MELSNKYTLLQMVLRFQKINRVNAIIIKALSILNMSPRLNTLNLDGEYPAPPYAQQLRKMCIQYSLL